MSETPEGFNSPINLYMIVYEIKKQEEALTRVSYLPDEDIEEFTAGYNPNFIAKWRVIKHDFVTNGSVEYFDGGENLVVISDHESYYRITFPHDSWNDDGDKDFITNADIEQVYPTLVTDYLTEKERENVN